MTLPDKTAMPVLPMMCDELPGSMETMTHRPLPLLVLLVAALVLSACATIYQSKPIHARVVDAGTGEPLEDVVILVDWRLTTASGNDAGSLAMQEEVSDEEGEFEIPALPPTQVSDGGASGIRLPATAPDVLLFKPGYRWISLANPGASSARTALDGAGPRERESIWNGKTIALKKFEGDLQSYARHVSQAFRGTTGCGFRKSPVMYIALFEVRERLLELGIPNSIVSIDQLEDQARGHDCGSVRDYFEQLAKPYP